MSVDDTNIRKFIEIYNHLEEFLKRFQFRDDLREELEQSHPGILSVVSKLRSDLEKADHGIVIAGFIYSFRITKNEEKNISITNTVYMIKYASIVRRCVRIDYEHLI